MAVAVFDSAAELGHHAGQPEHDEHHRGDGQPGQQRRLDVVQVRALDEHHRRRQPDEHEQDVLGNPTH
jgi:hypothetical protein